MYSLISYWVQQTSQFTPLVLEFSLILSRLLWGEFSAFSAADAIHNSPFFRSTRYPITVGWTECSTIWETCPTPLHMASSMTRALVTHQSTNQARCCSTAVIWWELVTTSPCATLGYRRWWIWILLLTHDRVYILIFLVVVLVLASRLVYRSWIQHLWTIGFAVHKLHKNQWQVGNKEKQIRITT